jgi:plastocyanin
VNKKALIVIILIVLLGFGVLMLQNSRQQNAFQAKIDQYQSSGEVIHNTEVRVDISSFAFQADIIKIKKGTKVIWTNEDSAKHTVTSDDGGMLDSPVLDKGATYEKTFQESGVYRYHCEPHPNMLGAIIVID